MDYLLFFAELVGTVAFAVSGATLAVQKRLDLFGIVFFGVVAALGGGTMRDLLLGHTPPRMFYNYEYVLLAVATALMVFVAAKHETILHIFNKADSFLFNLSDAVGLGIFAVTGTQTGILAGHEENAFFCIFLGMTTAVGGGILRDMLCGDIPMVLRKHIYAVAAIVGSSIFYVLDLLGFDNGLSSVTAMAVTILMRLLARHYRWNLPRVDETVRKNNPGGL